MKKILIVINSLYLGGGAEKVAATVGSKLHEQNYDVFYLTFCDRRKNYDFKGKYISIDDRKEIKNSFQAASALIKRAYNIKKVCKKEKIDIVTSFMEEANFASVLSKVIFRNRSKVFISVRNNPLAKKKVAKILIKTLYKFSDRVITNSMFVRDVLIKKFKLKNTDNIYNPIDFEDISKFKNENLDLEFKDLFNFDPVFINIGRLTKQKGQSYLIRAFREVVNKNKNAKLVILGEGELEVDLKKIIESLNLKKNVFLLGRRKNVYKYLNNSDCFVFTSLWEGLPNTMIEAVSMGLPVISTDCQSGPREILAPELDVDSKINYPYENERGVLLETFSLSDDRNDTIRKESILTKAMIDFTENKKRTKVERVNSFDIKKIIKEWEIILNK